MKYRALIVDDERIILNGILRLPVWLTLDIQPVPAMTGAEALTLIESQQFDLVITDIRMPEMDGLTFIYRLRLIKPHLPVVVLSGYDSFAYAREAIRYGVTDYLLKPVSPLDISETVTRIFQEIEEKRELRLQEEILRGKAKQTVGDANARQFEHALLGGKMDGRLERTLGERYILAECIPFENGEEGFGGLPMLLTYIREDVLGAERDGYGVVTLFSGHVVFAVNGRVAAESRILMGFRDWSLKMEYPFSISWILVTGGSSLNERYGLLSRISAYRFYHDGFCILGEEILKEASGQAADFEELEKVLKAAVKEGSPERACEELEKTVDCLLRLNRHPKETRKYCVSLYLHLAQQLEEGVRETGIMELLMTSPYTNLSGMSAMLRQLLAKWQTAQSERRQASYGNAVQTAMQYARSHLEDEGLNTAGVAGSVLFLHPDYFGRLFKKETGMAFTRYVMNLRMEKARKLIEERPDCRVYELCEATGFGDNPHYFSRVFRSCCGCTPSEYKKAMKRMGGEKH